MNSKYVVGRIVSAAVCVLLKMATGSAQGFDDGWVFGGNVLAPGGSADFTREFSAFKTYVIVAGGQQGADDVDMEILDSASNVVARDLSVNPKAQVVFRPVRSGLYTIRLTLARGVGRPLCFFMVFVTSGGWEISTETLMNVLAKVDATVLAAQNVAGAEAERYYGYIMQPRETNSMRVSGLHGDYVAFAVASDSARDIDLTVRRNMRILHSDTGPEAIAICFFEAYGGDVNIEVQYVSGRGPAIVVVGLSRKGLPGVRRL